MSMNTDPILRRNFLVGIASILGASVHDVEAHAGEPGEPGPEVMRLTLPTETATTDSLGIFVVQLVVQPDRDLHLQLDVTHGPWYPVGLRSFIEIERVVVDQITTSRGNELLHPDIGLDMAYFAHDEPSFGAMGSPWCQFDMGVLMPDMPTSMFLRNVSPDGKPQLMSLVVVGQLMNQGGCRFTADGPLYNADGTEMVESCPDPGSDGVVVD